MKGDGALRKKPIVSSINSFPSPPPRRSLLRLPGTNLAERIAAPGSSQFYYVSGGATVYLGTKTFNTKGKVDGVIGAFQAPRSLSRWIRLRLDIPRVTMGRHP